MNENTNIRTMANVMASSPDYHGMVLQLGRINALNKELARLKHDFYQHLMMAEVFYMQSKFNED